MLGQLWVVDEPEPVEGLAVSAGAGVGLAAASAGPAMASATPAATPITGSAARSQSLFFSKTDVTSMSWTHPVGEAVQPSCTGRMKKPLEPAVNSVCTPVPADRLPSPSPQPSPARGEGDQPFAIR